MGAPRLSNALFAPVLRLLKVRLCFYPNQTIRNWNLISEATRKEVEIAVRELDLVR